MAGNTGSTIDSENFARVWSQAIKEGNDVHWVAEQLGIPLPKIDGIVFYYRSKGIALARLRRHTSSGRRSVITPDVVEKLNKILRESDK